MTKRSVSIPWIRIVAYIESFLIVLPIVLIIAASFTETRYITFPPQGFSFKWYGAALKHARMLSGTIVSLRVAFFSSVVSVSFGIMSGIALSRSGVRGRGVFTTLFLAPLSVPVIVFSIGLLFFLGSLNLLRSSTGVVIAHVVLTFPYAVRMVSAAIGRGLLNMEQAAGVLGAKPLQVFWRITLPSLRNGIVGAFLFSFLVSLNNVTIALFLSGTRSETLPLVMFNLTQNQLTPELAAMASILIFVTVGLLIIMEKRFGVYSQLERQS